MMPIQRNMSPNKCPMPVQPAEVRRHNFSEVALGYTEEMAVAEARRCLNCPRKPCRDACPVAIDIPAFIERVASEDFEGAYQILRESTALPAVCGRVCPQETQCESRCVRAKARGSEAVGIGRLERFVADWHRANGQESAALPLQNGHRVAIIGAGPSGLTAAGELARKGYAVTLFEALHRAGGVLVYGIPEFRLPKAIVASEIQALEQLGVTLETNAVVGKALTIDELFEQGYEAIYVGTGAGLPRFLGIPGEQLPGVCSANEFLTRINLMHAYAPDSRTPVRRGKRVVVVGGGNVAMDAARSALRLGAEVTIVYRRGIDELPARQEEIHHAQEEGVVFQTLSAPQEILGYQNPDDPRDPKNGEILGMRCQKMALGEPDASGRRSPVPVEGAEFVVPCDTVIVAIGTSPNPLIRQTTPGLTADRRGCLVVDEAGETTREGVYAGGDAVTGAATVILAMGAGKRAAASIDRALGGAD